MADNQQPQNQERPMSKELYELRRKEKEKEQERANRQIATSRLGRNIVIFIITAALIGLFAWWVATMPSSASADVMDLCIQHQNIKLHTHPELSIRIKGKTTEIPANVGVSAACMRPVHTHDGSGVIHVEFPGPRNVPVKDFFKVWEKKFTPECIFDNCNGVEGQLRMTVNGKENIEFGEYLMKDRDRIEIIFE